MRTYPVDEKALGMRRWRHVLKREVRRKDGKEHVYYCLAETTRVGRERVVQRRLLNLGELNTTQIDRWQRSIEVIEEDGRACQRSICVVFSSPG